MKNNVKRYRVVRFPLYIAAIIVIVGCSDYGGYLIDDEPVAVFHGYINNVWCELTGYRSYPNQCRLDGDTIKIRLYSEDYNPSPTPSGMFMSLDIFPFYPETVITMYDTIFIPAPNGAKLGDVRFRLVTHDNMSCSYCIVPSDTVRGDVSFLSWFDALPREPGALFELYEMTVATNALGNYCGWWLDISSGKISGRIE